MLLLIGLDTMLRSQMRSRCVL